VWSLEKHIKIIRPFFEELDDKNSNSYLTWSVSHSWNIYISHQKEHKITDSSWNTIIWKWVFWDFFEEGISWTWIYLNSPTWMASFWNKLYFSDTLNNRVLYLSWSTIYKLLDENDWLIEPTWLFYDTTDDALYISNSGKWEIWKITSEPNIPPSKTLSFSWVTEPNINNFTIEFFRNKIPHNITSLNINNPFDSTSWDNTDCTSNICTHTFMSWAISETKDFSNLTTYDIWLSSLSDFSNSWVYSARLNIWSSERNFYLFTQWDGEIYTIDDNKIEIIRNWLNYPNWIWWTW
jgi:hypothetical protein